MAPKGLLEIDGLKIFTLNCWGLRYVSDHRQVRIKLIAQHLVDQDYDVVFLQEVWIQSDFEYIRTKTKFKYRFSHMFNNASLLGTSGLVILAKWTPKLIHFHPYSINGSPFRPFHGDWFSTKGVAYVRIELDGLNLHLFCTHMHAQYDINEKIIDQYSVHRICQAYELAKFINLMSCNCTNTTSKDLIIMAGDMNTSSKELPYRLLTELTDLNDCYKLLQQQICKHNSSTSNQVLSNKKEQITNQNSSMESNNNQQQKRSNNNRVTGSQQPDVYNNDDGGQAANDVIDEDESSDEELTTCGHRDNTFTPQQNLKSQEKTGKRIDFIFFKLRDSCENRRQSSSATNNSNKTLMMNNHNSSLNEFTSDNKLELKNNPTSLLFCVPERVSVMAKDVSGLSFSDHQPVVAKLNLIWRSSQIKDPDQQEPSTLNDIRMKFLQNSNNNNNSKLNKRKCKIDDDSNRFQRQISSSTCSSSSSSTPLYKRWRDSPLVQEIEDLLEAYIEKFKPSIKYSMILIMFMIISFMAMLVVLKLMSNLTYMELFLITVIFFLVTTVGLLLKFITHRTEINAIKAILNDIHRKKTFHPDYYGTMVMAE